MSYYYEAFYFVFHRKNLSRSLKKWDLPGVYDWTMFDQKFKKNISDDDDGGTWRDKLTVRRL